jgi:5-(carboxyamino)imidazole ribonucleotide synthase
MVVGIIGGGQLARMLALSGYPLGLEFIVLEPSDQACAAPVAEQLHGAYDDEALLAQLAERADVVTYEFENVPAKAVEFLTGKVDVYPPPQALATAQDRLFEKTMFRELGIDTPPFVAVASLDELRAAMDEVGYPAVMKTRREGYDGKGQAVLRSDDDLVSGWASIGEVPALVEGFVQFDRDVKVYPLTENTHREGMLSLSVAREGDVMQAKAEEIVSKLLNKLDYVGVIALELFHAGEQLLANEFAPRVHNSGHWTQDGAQTCQFENHLRAVLGLPLGETAVNGEAAAMVNLVGELPQMNSMLSHPHAHIHLYGKDPRPGRKLGHVNLSRAAWSVMEAEIQSLQKLPGVH